MKRIVLLCCFLGLVAASSEDLKATALEVTQNLKSYLCSNYNPFFDYENATAKVERLCSGFTNNIEAKLDKSIDCMANISLEGKTMCRVLHTDVPDCFENLIGFLEGCLEAPGSELPRWWLQVSKSATKYLCGATGEQQLELLNPCLYEDTEFSNRLFEEARGEKQKFYTENFKLSSKKDVCKRMLEHTDLLKSHITTACSVKITQDAIIGFMNAIIVAPCQDSDGSINNNAV